MTYIGGMSTVAPDQKTSLRRLGGLGALLKNPGLILMTLFQGRLIGADGAGNLYFEQRKAAALQHARRWVVYAGAPDASTIGPEWHGWLHYTTNAALADSGRKPWQKPHQPNLTGTPAGYRPAGHDYQGGDRARASADYESWSPEL